MLRGGSWINNGTNCRSANRNANEPDDRNDNYGFRLSRAPPLRGGEAQPRHPFPSGAAGRGKQAGPRRVSRARPERPPVARPLWGRTMNAPGRPLPPCFPEAWASGWGQDRWGLWQSFSVADVNQVMRWIPPGEFLMGSPDDEPERTGEGEWAETQHPVVLTQGFWLADTTCTQALCEAVLGENPSRFQGPKRPVEQVSWTDVVERFLPALDTLVPGLDAGLPTEAQWEYACRAGTDGPFSFQGSIVPLATEDGAIIHTADGHPLLVIDSVMAEQVNYDGNFPYAGGAKGEYRKQTVEVKTLPANAWGLYQMHGNVWEWCADWLGDYPCEAVVDPTGPSQGRGRVLRGGGWSSRGRLCRSASRLALEPADRNGFISFGFRLSRGSSPRPAGSAGGAGVAAGGRAPAATPATPARGRQQDL